MHEFFSNNNIQIRLQHYPEITVHSFCLLVFFTTASKKKLENEVWIFVYFEDGICMRVAEKIYSVSTKKTNTLVFYMYLWPMVDLVVRVICIEVRHEYFRKDFHGCRSCPVTYIYSVIGFNNCWQYCYFNKNKMRMVWW